MSSLKLLHSGGNGVIISAPSSNPAANRTITLNDTYAGDGSFVTANSSGNVGIGTASPSDKLHVRGASAAFTSFILDNATNSSSPYKITYGDQGQVNHIVVANRELTFGTNNAERMRIDGSGNMGYNNTAPSFTSGTGIHLGDNTFIGFGAGGDSRPDFQIGSEDGTLLAFRCGFGADTADASFNTSGDLRVQRIYSNTTSGGANVRVQSDGLMQRDTSSRRYKNTIADATHGLTDLNKLRPVTYKGNNDGDTVFGGLIAEEVHDAGLTEFVDYDSDNKPDALKYGNMVSLCIKAIQELSAKVETLETKVAALEGA